MRRFFLTFAIFILFFSGRTVKHTCSQFQINQHAIEGEIRIRRVAYIKQQIKKSILLFEGQYSNHPDDPGGETMKGITWNTYVHYSNIFRFTPDKQHFLQMPDSLWDKIFDDFYKASNAELIEDERIRAFVVDIFWGCGFAGGSYLIKQSLIELGCNVTSSSYLDQETIETLNRQSPSLVFTVLYNNRLNPYRTSVFYEGLKNRFDYYRNTF